MKTNLFSQNFEQENKYHLSELEEAELAELEAKKSSLLEGPPKPVKDLNRLSESIKGKSTEFTSLRFGGDPRSMEDIDLIKNVSMEISVELGRTKMLVRDILRLAPGSHIALDKPPEDLVDILVNNELIARGELVTIGDDFGVRILEIVD